MRACPRASSMTSPACSLATSVVELDDVDDVVGPVAIEPDVLYAVPGSVTLKSSPLMPVPAPEPVPGSGG